MKQEDGEFKISVINPIPPLSKDFYWRRDMRDMGVWYFGGFIYHDSDGWWMSNGKNAGWSKFWSAQHRMHLTAFGVAFACGVFCTIIVLGFILSQIGGR